MKIDEIIISLMSAFVVGLLSSIYLKFNGGIITGILFFPIFLKLAGEEKQETRE